MTRVVDTMVVNHHDTIVEVLLGWLNHADPDIQEKAIKVMAKRISTEIKLETQNEIAVVIRKYTDGRKTKK